MNTWRFLDTGALPGSMNMAIDEAILALHLKGQSPPTLRLYQWNPPALSLGHFQRRHGFDLEACRRRGFDVVRRPSGGKAVLHLGDLTYSVIAGTNDGIPATVRSAYALICQGLLGAFRLMGLEAAIGVESRSSHGSDLCFLRDGAGAISLKNKKLVGSAQTWRSSSMLQHGAILLESQIEAILDVQSDHGLDKPRARDALKARMTSLREILGFVPGHQALSRAIREGMGQVLKTSFVEGQLTLEEVSLAQQIAGQDISSQEAVAAQPLVAGHVGDSQRIGHADNRGVRLAGDRDAHDSRNDLRCGLGIGPGGIARTSSKGAGSTEVAGRRGGA